MKNRVSFTVRQTTPEDYNAVYDLIQTAFLTAEHRDGDEQDFAVRLRNSKKYIPELDLLAEVDGQPVGHIMFTHTLVRKPCGGELNALLVAPLSVLLEYRNLGIGTALMREGLRIAAAHEHHAAFLIGDPNYYTRMGYVPAHLYKISCAEIPPEYVMAYQIRPGVLLDVCGELLI